MSAKSKRGVERQNWKGWLLIGLLAFSAGAAAFLLVKNAQPQELTCRIKVADPVTGIIVLQCEK